jgi:hypothetical protein
MIDKSKFISILSITLILVSSQLVGCGKSMENSEETVVSNEITTTENITEVETTTVEETTTEGETSTVEEITTEEETTTETETFSYTVSELDKTMCVIASGQALDIPSENGNVIRTIDQNDTIKVTGKVNEADWYQVNIDNQTLYISSSLLSEIEVKTENKETTTSKETTSQNTTSKETTTKQETTTNTTNETPQTQETTPQTQPATDNTPASTPSSSDTTTSNSTLAPGESRVERDGSITTNIDNWDLSDFK